MNDGIDTPVVMVAIAGMVAEAAHRGGVGAALIELAIGLAAGAVLGRRAALRGARRRKLLSAAMAGPAVLSLALLAYTAALALQVTGSLRHSSGMAFTWAVGPAGAPDAGPGGGVRGGTRELVSMIGWLVFGAARLIVLTDGISLALVG